MHVYLWVFLYIPVFGGIFKCAPKYLHGIPRACCLVWLLVLEFSSLCDLHSLYLYSTNQGIFHRNLPVPMPFPSGTFRQTFSLPDSHSSLLLTHWECLSSLGTSSQSGLGTGLFFSELIKGKLVKGKSNLLL